MTFATTRFGQIDCAEEDTFKIPDGFLGFPDFTEFVVINHKEGSPFRWIQSIEHPGLAFLVIEPCHILEAYAPEISDADAQKIQLNETSAQIVYTIVSIPAGNPKAMTVNLAGPLVINADLQIGKQVVLTDDRWGTKHPIVQVGSAAVGTESASTEKAAA